jgi:hypothetical protein
MVIVKLCDGYFNYLFNVFTVVELLDVPDDTTWRACRRGRDDEPKGESVLTYM